MARPDGPGSRPSGHAPADREASPVDPSRSPAQHELLISHDEVHRILAWGDEHTASLRRHRSWLKDSKNSPLPGTELVIPEIDKDIGINLELMLKLYEHRNKLRQG